MLLAAIIGSYTLIGGLGATFYVSYFNTGFIIILILLLILFSEKPESHRETVSESERLIDYLRV